MKRTPLLAMAVGLLTFFLVAGYSAAQSDSQTWRLLAGPTLRASISTAGAEGNGESQRPATSGNGRYVAYQSRASNLVGGDTNGVTDVFVHNLETGETTRVSVGDDEKQANCSSQAASISGGGRTVAFHSCAFNLVAGDTNNVQDVFVRDRQTGETRRVSVHSNGTQGNDISLDPSVSGDSRYVAFWSYADNLVDGDTRDRADVFVHDQNTRQTRRISVNGDGDGGNGDSQYPAISGNGRYVAYQSAASNLVAGDSGIYSDIFIYDLATGHTERVSVSDTEQEAQGDSWSPSVSGDGRYVAFVSLAANLVAGDSNSYPDVFVRDRQAGRTIRVNVSSNGDQVHVYEDDQEPVVSSNGRYVAFKSRADNLVPGDDNQVGDVFLRDLQTGITLLGSVSSDGTQGNDASQSPALSDDGRYVGFSSKASNLVPGDSNGQRDIFVHDQVEPLPPPAININYRTGAPGSYFRISGSNYPANDWISVYVNKQLLSTSVPTDAAGNFEFILNTGRATPGNYLVEAVGVGPSLSVAFRLDTSFPTRPQEGSRSVLEVPAGIGLNNFIYAPIASGSE